MRDNLIVLRVSKNLKFRTLKYLLCDSVLGGSHNTHIHRKRHAVAANELPITERMKRRIAERREECTKTTRVRK